MGRRCRKQYPNLLISPKLQGLSASITGRGIIRQFSSTPALAVRKPHVRPQISKASLAAKEKRRALKARKSLYENEKMPLLEAVRVLQAVEVSRPHATYELTVKTQMGKGIPVPRGRINMPREPKPKLKDKVLVFADGRQADEARRAGADIVGGSELIEGVASGRITASTFLCTPALLRTIAPRLGRILGPRGLMPSERRGTVTEDIAGYLKKIQHSSEWKGDKAGTIRTAIAKMHFPPHDVVKNAQFFMTAVRKATGNITERNAAAESTKPTNAILKVILSSTQGPGIQISDL
ncbi:ribosomal protein L1 [Rickenella mellea]|uniref:Ribosomal protein L1 n=1 Tax=Rickenella mellea TaxID=50990 RepID=A0A4Y7QLR0_9AGAM|nr:ribosomal protein L1 [Rickenella mellea]